MDINIFRPKCLQEFIGQKNIVDNLNVFIQSAKKRKQSLDHIILYGPSGLGKTSLVYLIAKLMDKKIYILNGPSLQKPSDIISPLTSLKENEILFIDEIHAVSKEVYEVLYPVLEDNKLNIIIGKEYNSKVVNIKIPNFTLIGATTEISKLPNPFFNRFPITFHFQPYSDKQISEILKINCKKLNITMENEVIDYISLFCQNSPRIAVNTLKRIYDFQVIEEYQKLDLHIIKEIFKKLEIYDCGLKNQEVTYLQLLNNHHFLSLETIEQIMGLNQQIIIKNIEPILIKNFLIEKTSRGRKITEKGKNWISNNI